MDNHPPVSGDAREAVTAIIRFGIHTAVGVVLFVMIALIAVVLHKFVGWLESIGAPYYVTSSLKVMEVGLFVVDVALFTLFVAKEVVILVLRMMRSH